ncbi:protein bark beetle-like, partial [Stegodyphus dumicola]|uniref:protein bark beetle-like n=1 Tax=Stegodyphus dumicola TaxID=202533 RepID=UPI0015A9F14C
MMSFIGGVWWVFLLTFASFQNPALGSTDFGGYISSRTELNWESSPYEVRRDIIIERDATLIIRPGVQLRFAPGVGLTVMTNGILDAKGKKGQEIVFTRLPQRQVWSEPEPSGWPDVRLVDGDSILKGRLQLFYKQSWRSVCTNSKNWTEETLQVTCRQLGFSGGRIHHWYPRNNDSSQLMYEDPRCAGNESSLFHCPNWNLKQLGSGVCDFHFDIGIECDDYLGSHSSSNWRGIKFNEAKLKESIENKVTRYVSLSVLEHVNISYAGRDIYGRATAALEVIGQPPVMNNVDIRHAAFDAVNIYKPKDAFIVENTTIAENRGHGVFINSSVSQATLSGVSIADNGGNGIHFTHYDHFGKASSLCDTGNIGDEQIYPVWRSHVQTADQFYFSDCTQVFQVSRRTGQVLTVNFMGFSSDFTDSAHASHIEVYDGESTSSRLLASVPVLNNTFPESVTSSREKILLKYRPKPGYYAAFVIEILANHGRAFDLNVTNCNITSNLGKGITVHHQRSGILVNSSLLNENSYMAGLDISTGSGHVVVNNTFITGNRGDGINITYAGGFVHIDRSSVSNNIGRGIGFWFNETSDHRAYNHSVHVTRSEFVNNSLYGILVGNQCLSDSFWNISLNSFRNNKDCSLLISSCWSTKQNTAQSIVLVTHNQFLGSDYFAVKASPILHTHLLVEHNEFTGHERGVLFVNGLDDDNFSNVRAKIDIQHNYFAFNYGKFVVSIGVAQGTSFQDLLFYKNHLERNVIKEPFPSLNPRSRVAAVVVVTSQNTHVYRNRFENFESLYDLGSHLEKHHIMINATHNYWGSINVHKIYERIFDRKDRYNLARIEFLPHLTLSSDLDTKTAISDVHERDKIIPFQTGSEIGGEVPGFISLQKGTYIVKRDIFVRPGNGKLQIEAGSVLKFDRSVGMMVQGRLLSESGYASEPITYTINEAKKLNDESKVRLSRGTEGLLEVLVNGSWASVCDYGWDIVDASIACNQMGLVLHPEDWILEQSEFDKSGHEIRLSNLQCTLQDTDITLCKAEKDFENSCSTKVGLRCYPPSWSGLRLGMSAEESRLKNVIIEFAGLLDYATNSFKPALQVDFNKHHLENLKIQNNTDSGVGIMWNEMFAPERQKIVDSYLLSNRRHGLVVHSQGLNIHRCDMSRNAASGIHYNPMFSKMEQRDLISWINLEEPGKVIKVPDDIQNNIFLNYDEYRYLIFSRSTMYKKFSVTTTPGRSIGIIVLNSFRKSSSENMKIYGRLEIVPDVQHWDLRQNLTAFPLRTPGYGMLVEYQSGQNPSGEAIVYIASVDGQRNKAAWETHPSIHINSVKIHGCSRGISSHHYNRDVSDYGDHFHRYTNETILITNTDISYSRSEAMFVWTPFWDPYIKNLAEINYTIINCTMLENSKVLLHYSRDIRNSNNLFHWTINNTLIENNAEGGIDIRLPYVWQYSENFTHSFAMHNCSLRRNRGFEFSISGHFARINISQNIFENNICKKGILSFLGMEKELLIEDNFISNNSAAHGIEFNLQSHANKFGVVPASFRRNIVTHNLDIGSGQKFGYQPTSYAVGIRGVQLINITRNLFENINMQFELLAGVLTGSIEKKINVRENWWGTDNATIIQNRIFDFDDWNGYAIAEFAPYLRVRNIDGGTLSFNNEQQSLSVNGVLGGRLFDDLMLEGDKRYVIASDLTVMPGVRLTLEPGVVLEFYPSVGILALGDIVAQGTINNPIILKPAKIFNERRFRRQAGSQKERKPRSRLCVNEKNCERRDGFLEVYNSTTQQWVPVCDARFTERNAQVVCKELGYNVLNVYVSFGPRLDMGPTQTSHIRSWPHPFECIGTESALDECEYRLNGYIDNYKCPFDGDFVYVSCGPETLSGGEEHWGGIRFSISNFEPLDSPHNRPTLSYATTVTSKLENIKIEGAGVLHNEKSAAIQLIQREIQMDYVNISGCASHGIEIIAVDGSLSFNELVISNNMGVGVNILSLTGESSSDVTASKLVYSPLKSIDMSYGIFGMVDICDTNKTMEFENRLLVYYKYDNQPVDCVKIFTARHYGKQIGFRLLQFNLFDGAKYAAKPDSIQIFDGDIFNTTVTKLASIGWHLGSENAEKFYVSSGDTLSVFLHTIGGSSNHGFIAEVVTLPIAHSKARDSQHNISYSEISHNGREGIAYRSAGEITPAITLRYNRIIQNGQELFGNFTTADSAVLLDIQNTKGLYFYNNLIMKNQGGLTLRVNSQSAVSALNGMIVNNLFTENKNREVLNLQGRKSGTFQYITILRNYFTRNYAYFRDIIVVSQVMSNLTENMAYNNTGRHLADVQGFERVPLSYQTCTRNWFWRNRATDYWDRSTIVANKAGQRFNFNYLVNPDNDFELAARNRTLIQGEIQEFSINATYNWWGFNGTAAVSGRIKDFMDFEDLLLVDYSSYLHDNSTVLN